jgi:hypothetical protein
MGPTWLLLASDGGTLLLVSTVELARSQSLVAIAFSRQDGRSSLITVHAFGLKLTSLCQFTPTLVRVKRILETQTLIPTEYSSHSLSPLQKPTAEQRLAHDNI